MKVLMSQDDWALMECNNKHKFEVNPHTEENLFWNEKVLKAECPTCKEKED